MQKNPCQNNTVQKCGMCLSKIMRAKKYNKLLDSIIKTYEDLEFLELQVLDISSSFCDVLWIFSPNLFSSRSLSSLENDVKSNKL